MDDVETFFAGDGPLARVLDDYAPRPQQVEMARAVERAVIDRGHLIVEAGTGVGKSFAYLVPALLHALPHGRRVVVSTHTISLQEQLVEKDIPVLERALPEPFSVEIAKGRNNYLAPRRLSLALKGAASSARRSLDAPEYHRLESWAARTRFGERQELVPRPDPEIWEQVQSEHGNCLGTACPHHAARCFYHAARRRVEAAQCVVVNHSLLLADMALRRRGARLLPDYDVAIIDEAHTIESVAREHFGVRVSRAGLMRLLDRLDNPRRRRGLLASMTGVDRARRMVDRVRREAESFFADVVDFCGGSSRTREITADAVFARSTLLGLLDGLADELLHLSQGADGAEREIELTSYARRIGEASEAIATVLDAPEIADERVHWAQTGSRPGRVEVLAQPLDVAAALRDELFDRVGTVVMTSATLGVQRRGGLSWFARNLGADHAECVEVGSPFDYRRNVVLRVPTWLDEPSEDDEYRERLAKALLHYVERTNGGAFLLFTSHDALHRAHSIMRPRLDTLGLEVFVQGADVPRRLMIERFRAAKNGVLFGTDSFWHGVDVRGDALRLVAIVRLPFPVPTQPLQRARSDRIRRRGGDPFRDLALPEAIIRFKQGFGRLIRTESDRGVVVVCDTRIVTRRYGRRFLEAIPPVRLIED